MVDSPTPPHRIPTRRAASSPVGRPALGADLGGSGFRVALVDGDGRTAASRVVRWPTDGTPPSPAEAVARLARAIRDLGGPGDLPVGLAVPGTLDAAHQSVVRAPNLGWEDAPVAELATRALGTTVRVVHDAWAAAEAERRAGTAPADRRTLVVPIGTGISAALVAGNRVVLDLPGEMGHLDVGSGRRCRCGAVGCLETVASAESLTRRWRTRSGLPAAGAREVVEAVRTGDPQAGAVWADAVEALVTALLAAVRMLGPDRVVLAGGLAGAGALLSEPVGAALATRAGFQSAPGVVTSTLGQLAGALGAAGWAQSGGPAVVRC